MATYFDPATDKNTIATISYTQLSEMQELYSLIASFVADPSSNLDFDILLYKMRLLNTRYVKDNNTALTPTQGTIERLLFVGNDFWAQSLNTELIYCMTALKSLLTAYIALLQV